MSTENLDYVRRVAREIDNLYFNPVDRDDIENRIYDQEEEWRDLILRTYFDNIIDEEDEDFDVSDLEGDDLVEFLTEHRLQLDPDEAEEYFENRKILEELENGSSGDLYEYFSDCLDIEYIIGSDGSYRGCNITITTGGPHIEVQTRRAKVCLWWGGEEASWHISRDTADAIDGIFEEYYQCLR